MGEIEERIDRLRGLPQWENAGDQQGEPAVGERLTSLDSFPSVGFCSASMFSWSDAVNDEWQRAIRLRLGDIAMDEVELSSLLELGVESSLSERC